MTRFFENPLRLPSPVGRITKDMQVAERCRSGIMDGQA